MRTVTLVGRTAIFIAHIPPYSDGKRQYSVNSLAEQNNKLASIASCASRSRSLYEGDRRY